MSSSAAARRPRVDSPFIRAELTYTTPGGWLVSYVDPDDGHLFATSDDWPGHPLLGLLGRGDKRRAREIAQAMIDRFAGFFFEWAEQQRPRLRLVRPGS